MRHPTRGTVAIHFLETNSLWNIPQTSRTEIQTPGNFAVVAFHSNSPSLEEARDVWAPTDPAGSYRHKIGQGIEPKLEKRTETVSIT
jgi:hypothetical protein